MAGAGYKLFNTGDVLTAAQVNTYLQEQTVMVFADAAARTTALSGVLSEGMITYLKDTNAVEKYTGSAWVNIDTGSTSPLTTKGDLYTYSTTDTRLAVGNNGETLVADSSASTGLRWQGNFAAGKNQIINGDFRINQRSFSSTTSDVYGHDRWASFRSGGTATYSTQTFTLGSAPIAGYEGTNFAQIQTSGQSGTSNYCYFSQKIESVRTLAGTTATLSFWARVTSGTASLWTEIIQSFGTGGSPSGTVITTAGTSSLTTSWQRFSVTVSIPSISGKTIGTNNNDYLEAAFFTSAGSAIRANMGIQNVTVQIWGVQLETGNVATAFQTATGTLAGELAACQRYYFRTTGQTTSYYTMTNMGFARNTTIAYIPFQVPVTMRAMSSLEYANIRAVRASTDTGYTSGTFTFTSNNTLNIAELAYTHGTGVFTQGENVYLGNNNSASAYIAINGEL